MYELRQNKLLIISFINGAGLMMFELVAARLLAPTIGSSTYVWTSVIGVIIAMLALGSWLGGRVADKRGRYLDVALILLLSALTISMVVAFAQPLLTYIMHLQLDPRLAGVLASLFLFAPASFLIGFNGPYLAKLNIKSLEDSGRSVANLDSLHSLGGIIGTFITGFVLFALIGSMHILIMLVFVFVILSWAIAPKEHAKLRLGLSFMAIIMAFSGNYFSNSIHIDTPSAQYVISNTTIEPFGDTRLLITGPGGYQSGVSIENPDELVFWYPQIIANTVAEAPQKDSILILGGGAYTIPRYLAKKYPNSKIDVVEIDPQLADISAEYFYYTKPKNVNHIFSDARTFINTTQNKYDIIIVDVYSDASVPFTILTKEYGKGIKKATSSNGIVLANIIADDASEKCLPFFRASLIPYADNFRHSSYVKQTSGVSNIIAMFTNLDNFSLNKNISSSSLENTPRYTDDFSPGEKLQFNCR